MRDWKYLMERLLPLLAGASLIFSSPASAGGFGHTYPIGTGMVVISNTQANSSWVPVSVLIRYVSPATGTAEVSRVSQDYEYVLAACTFTNVTSIVWVPDIEYPFTYGDALVIESSVTNGVVQVLRKGD